MREIKFRGKREDNGEWVYGYLMRCTQCVTQELSVCIGSEFGLHEWVIPSTVGQYTGLKDKDGKEIYEGDITQLILPNYEDYEARFFEVAIKTSVREKLICYEGFEPGTAKVAITGVVFMWNGFDLFPCIDDKGISDNEKMNVIGNIHDTPKSLENWWREDC
ncbi:MAG: YopX family protein [Fibromonadaceae bacterium]|jgi:uncharacterized phage protein (TIGR01671 family)|nr:YopX family protein [Fibromonadaceae bacterium]